MENTPSNIFPKFRYQNLMATLAVPCPPVDFVGRETAAFRWVFEKMDDSRNFEPQYFKNPTRFLEKRDIVKCQSMGLSLFDSATNAKVQFSRARKYMREDANQLGTHLAKGTIRPDFGMMDLPNEKGHFTFHSYENLDLAAYFAIISPL